MFFKVINKLNKLLLPNFTRKGIDMAKAKKWQLAIIGWKYYILKKTLQ